MTPLRPAAIQSHVDDHADVITWSNWGMPKDWALCGGLTIWMLFWVPLTVGITYATVRGSAPVVVSVVFVPLSWGGLLAGLAAYLRLGAREAIRVTNDSLELRIKGVLRDSTKRYPRDAVRGLSLERHDEDSVRTLNLWSRGSSLFPGRTILAYGLGDRAKAEIYQLLRASFERRGWEVDYRSDLEGVT